MGHPLGTAGVGLPTKGGGLGVGGLRDSMLTYIGQAWIAGAM